MIDCQVGLLLDQCRAAIRAPIGEVHTTTTVEYRGKFSSWPRRRRMPGYCSRPSFWASLFSSDDSATVASGGIDRRCRRRRRRQPTTLKADTRASPAYASSHLLRLPASCFHDLALPLSSSAALFFFFLSPLVCFFHSLLSLFLFSSVNACEQCRLDNARDISRFFYFGREISLLGRNRRSYVCKEMYSYYF